jgi:hypothetical protein
LSGLQSEDAETMRYAILGYCKNTLLKEANDRAGELLEEFEGTLYSSGFAGLVLHCYKCSR